jgi:hypothetical protein
MGGYIMFSGAVDYKETYCGDGSGGDTWLNVCVLIASYRRVKKGSK